MTSRRWFVGAAVLVLAAGAAGCGTDKLALGPAGSATVWGTVVDRASRAPVAGATVWASPASLATTDAAGRYSLRVWWSRGDPTVDYGQGCNLHLRASRSGYQAADIQVTCVNGSDYEEDIQLDAAR